MECGSSASTRGAASFGNVADWERWQQRVERTMEALVGLTSLFLTRQVSCPLHTLQTSLSQMTGNPFDEVTLQVLLAVWPSFLSVVRNPESGPSSSSNGTSGTSVSLVVYEDSKDDGGKGGPTKKKAKRAPSKGFKAQPAIRDLEGKVSKIKSEFKVKLAAFISSRKRGEGGKRKTPPPLNRREQEEEEERRKAAGASSSSDDEPGEGKRRSWSPQVKVTAGNFLDYVEATMPWYEDQIKHREHRPARPARMKSVESMGSLLGPAIHAALSDRGVRNLYIHQAQAIEAVMGQGDASPPRDVIITTATASGKSLCYTLPLFQTYTQQPHSTRAIFLFPTKALAQDQLGSLRSLASSCCPSLVASCLDGDTPKPQRASVRDTSHLLLTNPDMLHVSILPTAATDPHWSFWLAQVRYVVIDEAHHYRGAFGSHVSLIVRRLLRMCAHCSSPSRRPVVICCSATIANPRDHAGSLTGLSPEGIVVVDEDGSPQGPRTIALWNAPFIRQEGKEKEEEEKEKEEEEKEGATTASKRRRSSYKDTANLLAELVKRGIRTLVFVKVRYIAELVLQLARERLPDDCKAKVASYRAGYLADKRRELEQGLSSGRLVGVVSTNALELGVDVGDLDVTLHVGIPASMSSLRQQAGRAGRKGNASLSVVIALDSALDQYLVAHPEDLFGRAVEAAVADPSNPVVLAEHLRCAAYELALKDEQDAANAFGEAAREVVKGLCEENKLLPVLSDGDGRRGSTSSSSSSNSNSKHDGRALQLADRRKPPAGSINIRSIGSGSYSLINMATNTLMETLEAQTAFYEIYEGAVYRHQGDSYVIKQVDMEEKKALLKREEVNYFTAPRDHTRVTILGQRTEAVTTLPSPSGGLQVHVCTGAVRVVKQVYGYKVQDKRTTRVIDTVELFLPPMQYDTTALWVPDLPSDLRHRFKAYGPGGKPHYSRFGQAGLHAIEHVLITLAPLEVMCDPADLSCQHTRRDSDLHQDKLLLFETHRGGTGLVQRLAPRLPALLLAAYHVVKDCPCEQGCQSCIMLGSCYEEGLEKAAALEILEYLVGGGASAGGGGKGGR